MLALVSLATSQAQAKRMPATPFDLDTNLRVPQGHFLLRPPSELLITINGVFDKYWSRYSASFSPVTASVGPKLKSSSTKSKFNCSHAPRISRDSTAGQTVTFIFKCRPAYLRIAPKISSSSISKILACLGFAKRTVSLPDTVRGSNFGSNRSQTLSNQSTLIIAHSKTGDRRSLVEPWNGPR